MSPVVPQFIDWLESAMMTFMALYAFQDKLDLPQDMRLSMQYFPAQMFGAVFIAWPLFMFGIVAHLLIYYLGEKK